MAVAVFVHVFWCVLRGDIPIPSLVGGIFPHLSSPLHLVSVNCVGSIVLKASTVLYSCSSSSTSVCSCLPVSYSLFKQTHWYFIMITTTGLPSFHHQHQRMRVQRASSKLLLSVSQLVLVPFSSLIRFQSLFTDGERGEE